MNSKFIPEVVTIAGSAGVPKWLIRAVAGYKASPRRRSASARGRKSSLAEVFRKVMKSNQARTGMVHSVHSGSVMGAVKRLAK